MLSRTPLWRSSTNETLAGTVHLSLLWQRGFILAEPKSTSGPGIVRKRKPWSRAAKPFMIPRASLHLLKVINLEKLPKVLLKNERYYFQKISNTSSNNQINYASSSRFELVKFSRYILYCYSGHFYLKILKYCQIIKHCCLAFLRYFTN